MYIRVSDVFYFSIKLKVSSKNMFTILTRLPILTHYTNLFIINRKTIPSRKSSIILIDVSLFAILRDGFP